MATTVFDAVGGLEAFERLAGEFYARVESDEVLRPLYPASLAESREHLALFMAQYFGGPPLYSERRGHPRLRMRHLPFAIGRRERDAWVRNMLEALTAVVPAGPVRDEMARYFEEAATFMINQEEGPAGGPARAAEGGRGDAGRIQL